MPTISEGLRQAYDLQDFAFAAVEAIRADYVKNVKRKQPYTLPHKLKPADAAALAQLHTVWRSAQERISFHRRVPNPGSLKPEKVSKPKRKPAPRTILP